MTYHQQLTLSLSPQLKATPSAFAVAKGLGQFQEAQRLRRRYEAKLESERYELNLQQRREYYELLEAEEWRQQREEKRRLNEEAFIDSYGKMPAGRVPMWRLIRGTRGEELNQLSVDRYYRDRSNCGKRNCGRKPRRSW